MTNSNLIFMGLLFIIILMALFIILLSVSRIFGPAHRANRLINTIVPDDVLVGEVLDPEAEFENTEDASAAAEIFFSSTDNLQAENSSAAEGLSGYFALALKENPSRIDRMLLRAGIFSRSGQQFFTYFRISLVVLSVVGASLFFGWNALINSPLLIFSVMALAILAGWALPLLVLKQLEKIQKAAIADAFPDFLDLMVICLETGMTPEAALEEIGKQMAQSSPAFGLQILIVVYEVRAGRTAFEALYKFSDRVSLPAARSLASLMQESIQLGLSVGKAVRVYSREMRQTQLLEVEEKANALPVKMLLPLTAFMLPANMIVIVAPAIIGLVRSLRSMLEGIG